MLDAQDKTQKQGPGRPCDLRRVFWVTLYVIFFVEWGKFKRPRGRGVGKRVLLF